MNILQWIQRKRPAPVIDTYLEDLARQQQEAWDTFAALPFDDPDKTIAWWEYRFAQNRRTHAIVDGVT